MKLTTKQAKETALHYGGKYHYVWTCEASDLRQRPKGRPMSEGCGKKNVRTTKNFFEKKVKGRCKSCGGRRRNLNEGNVQFFIDRQSALEYIVNGEWFE
tara:strand:+ start:218 stop:514 length:297 start_codon:yes stop_codon:yes gene_type:complete